jgi:hypothetical protein
MGVHPSETDNIIGFDPPFIVDLPIKDGDCP